MTRLFSARPVPLPDLAPTIVVDDDGTNYRAKWGSTGVYVCAPNTDGRTVVQAGLDAMNARGLGETLLLKSMITLPDITPVYLYNGQTIAGVGMGSGFKIDDAVQHTACAIRNEGWNTYPWTDFHQTIYNLELDGNYLNRPALCNDSYLINFRRASDFDVNHCFIHDNPNGSVAPAIYVDGCRNGVVVGSRFWGARYKEVMFAHHYSGLVQGNYFTGGYCGINFYRPNNEAAGHVAVGNIFYDMVENASRAAIHLEETQGNVIAHNTFYDLVNAVSSEDNATYNCLDNWVLGNVQSNVTNFIHATRYGVHTMHFRDNVLFNPFGAITNPFGQNLAGTRTMGLLGNAANPTANADHIVSGADIFFNSTGGTGVSITIQDPASAIIETVGATATNKHVPIGYIVNFGGFTVAPTVTVWGN